MFFNIALQIFLFFSLFQNIFCSDCEVDCRKYKVLCNLKSESCSECIGYHPCCTYCYQQDFLGPKCDLYDNLNNTCENVELNSKSCITKKHSDIYQLNPTEFKIKLRKDQPLNLSFTYTPQANHPLDVYFLMDISYSMKDHLEEMKTLGSEITNNLKNLTEDYRVGLGFYMDKIVMPFSYVDDVHKSDPCDDPSKNCTEGYLFRHVQNFTNDVSAFISQLELVRVSANLDNLDGASDAIMQVVTCKKFGWRDESRKLILVPTESFMHFAGDGVLGGAIKKHPGTCLLDSDLNSGVYDYPSLEELHEHLIKAKVNVIIAIKETTQDYYNELYKKVNDSTYVGFLKETEEIFQIIKSGYESIVKRAHFSINDTSNHLGYRFFSKCNAQTLKDVTDFGCEDMVNGKSVEFIVELSYNSEIGDTNIIIEERNINNTIELTIDYSGGECKCNKASVKECLNGGISHCGKCQCTDDWSGEFCETSCDSNHEHCIQQINGAFGSLCTGRGDCDCGKCKCDTGYVGDYCEYECPLYRNKVCNDQGVCGKGMCYCDPPFTGKDCSCSLSRKNCEFPGAETCMGHGTCNCNACDCNYKYSGDFCNLINGTNLICKIYQDCVKDAVVKKKYDCVMMESDNLAKAIVSIADDEPNGFDTYCDYQYDNCQAPFEYKLDGSNIVRLTVLKPYCRNPVKAGFEILGIITAVIVGLGIIGLFIWKQLTLRRDRAEYAKFMEQINNELSNTTNPLYTSPKTNYNNPLYKKQ